MSTAIEQKKAVLRSWTDKDLNYVLNMSAPDEHKAHNSDTCMWCLCKSEMDRRHLPVEDMGVVELIEYVDKLLK